MINAHEIADFRPTFFEMIDGLPSLWDEPGAGRTPAVCITKDDGTIVITTDPEIVAEYLEP